MNFIDRIVEFFSPKIALERAKNRVALKQMSRAYDAASKGRRWNKAVYSTSSNSDRRSLAILRERSRDMRNNNSYHSGSIERIAGNVVGTGIRPTPLAKGQLLESLTKNWKNWADSRFCDFDEELNFYGLQDLVVQAVMEDGEVLVLKKRIKNSTGIPIQLHVIQIDHLDTSKDGIYNGVKYIQGIEYKSNGKKAAYWIYKEHPNEQYGYNNTVSVRIPVEDILHIKVKKRAGQARGVPNGVSAFLRSNDLEEYEDAQVVRQKVAACYVGFVTDGATLTNGDQATRDELSRMEPGTIEYLSPGQTVTFASPPQAEGYKDFSSGVLHGIATGYGMSYESLTGDLSQVNFSSARMGWIEFQRNIYRWQNNMMIPLFCERVWEWFIEACKILGITNEDVKATWTPPRREMIDPVKEINGLKSEIKSGLTPWSEAVRSLGYNPDESIEQISADFKKFDEKGIILDIDARQDLKTTKKIKK